MDIVVDNTANGAVPDLDRSKEAPRFTELITAPDGPEEADVPQFIADRADLSIDRQAKYAEVTAAAVLKEAEGLRLLLTDFLSTGAFEGEEDDTAHDYPSLPESAAPLAERLNQSTGKLAQAYKQLRFMSRRLQP